MSRQRDRDALRRARESGAALRRRNAEAGPGLHPETGGQTSSSGITVDVDDTALDALIDERLELALRRIRGGAV